MKMVISVQPVRLALKLLAALTLGLLLASCKAAPTPTPNWPLPIPAPTATPACVPHNATPFAAPTSASNHPIAGSLDPTFGEGGIVLTYPEDGGAVAIQADGKIVTAGTAPSKYVMPSSFALHRYNTDGSLDCTFGSGGTVLTNPYGDGHDSGASAVTIQTDGKIVAAGTLQSLALARYNTDGSLDPMFGTGGIVTTDPSRSGGFGRVTAILQSDGKLVLAGQASNEQHPASMALARFNGDGSLDTTFGTGGIVMTDMNRFGAAFALAVQADGKIVAAGTGNSDVKMFNFALVRYNTDGSLDPMFGNGGIVLTGLGRDPEGANALAIQSDSKIVVAGQSSIVTGRSTFALLRYNPDGSFDPTFGSGGKAITYLTANDAARGVAIQADGKIVATGITIRNDNTAGLLLVRYYGDGSLDATFGSGGKVITAIGSNDSASAMALQADGKIIVVGTTDARPPTSSVETWLPPKCTIANSLLLLRYLP